MAEPQEKKLHEKEKEIEPQEKKLIGKFTPKGIVFDYEEFCLHVGYQSAISFLKQAKFTKTKRMGHKYSTKESCFYKIVEAPNKLKYLIFARFMLDDLIEVIKVARAKRNLLPNWSMKDSIHEGEAIPEDRLEPGPTLDENQQIVVAHLLDTVYTVDKHKRAACSCTVVMGTGSGKSYIAAAMVGELGKKALIIAPSDIVLNETRKALKSCYPTLKLGEYTGSTKKDGDVVLTIINSALSDTFLIDEEEIPFYKYFARFGLCIFDEIHNYTSAARQEIFWRTNFKYCLGLTATPDENAWDMDIVFQQHVGPLVRDTMIPDYNMQSILWRGVVFPIYYHGPSSHTKVLRNDSTGWTSYINMIKQFDADPYRNKLIMKKLAKLWQEGRNTFVFVVTREQATFLSDMFKTTMSGKLGEEKIGDEKLPDAILLNDAMVLMGGAKQSDMKRAANASVVFTTYSFGWQGVSIPKMDTIFFADPRMAKMRQILGRILRKSGDTTIVRQIIDIIDIETKLGADEYKERVKFYEETQYYDFEIQCEEIVRWNSFE